MSHSTKLSVKVGVRVVGDVGCERIHEEKKVQRVNVLFYFSKGRKGLGEEKCTSTSTEGLGL